MRLLPHFVLTLFAADPLLVQLTAAEDHRRLLNLLNITELRGADGRNPQASNAANYDESKATPYHELPDPLLSNNGKKIANAERWWKERRPEILEHFSSGAGGVELHRRYYGEQVENVAAPNEYHWMAGNYLKYSGPLTAHDLPVDAHHLIALCAPRPVFISSGDQGDGWVDAKGMFLAGAGAESVYHLLGKGGLGTAGFPPLETALTNGEIAFRQHRGGHTPGPNWPVFLDFAGRYWK